MLRKKKLLKKVKKNLAKGNKKLPAGQTIKKKPNPITPVGKKRFKEGEVWSKLGLHDNLVKALIGKLGFTTPTEIQSQSIPIAIRDKKDIIGAAETGSGKTLAFGLPVLNHILTHQHSPITHDRLTTTSSTSSGGAKVRKRPAVNIIPSKGSDDSIIDLNQVILNYKDQSWNESNEHENESEELVEYGNESEQSGNESNDEHGNESNDEYGNESNDEYENESNDEYENESNDENESLSKRHKASQGELVYCEDDIPDDIFEQMINGTSLDQIKTDNTTIRLKENEKKEEEEEKEDINRKGCFLADSGLIALILTPTRELALQVTDHIKAAATYTDIKVCAVVGGMSSEKQERLLKLHPQVVIATPGRLWHMIKEEGNAHLNNFSQLKFLILDEADRMIEQGHFRELVLILEKITHETCPSNYRRMVFSATLTLPRKKTSNKRKVVSKSSGEESMEGLMMKAGLSEEAAVVNLTTNQGTVERLTESKIICTLEDKDLYLYYMLLILAGRILVFTNSLDCLHRLKSLLEILKLHPLPLHARMQQRQRLKNLDRFKADPNGLLLASDVAARGLDIPKVEHIIHYQVPKSTEIYVHRSGRTARGQSEGTSLMLIGPEDLQSYRNICQTLNREKDLPNFPVDLSILKPLRARIKLAKKVDTENHKLRKAALDHNWFTKTAEAMDILIDEDIAEETGKKMKESKSHKDQLHSYKVQLNQLLKQELRPTHLSLSFPSVQLLNDHKMEVTRKLEQQLKKRPHKL